jgi:transcriptional regulator with XRE-family HTH domain
MTEEELMVERFNRLGAKIAYYRRLRQLKQIDLAYEAGISEQYLSRIERGRQTTGLTLLTLYKLADKLEVKVVDLFIDKDE